MPTQTSSSQVLTEIRRNVAEDIARCEQLTGLDAAKIKPMLHDLRTLLREIDEAIAFQFKEKSFGPSIPQRAL